MEANCEFSNNTEEGLRETSTDLGFSIYYGLKDNWDVTLGLPYSISKETGGGETVTAVGIAEVSISTKWRFWEQDCWSLALSPGISLPTANVQNELGNSKPAHSLNLIATKEMKPWNFHFNLAYAHNEFIEEANQRKDILSTSLASEYEMTEKFKIVANTGLESNSDKTSDIPPAFILGGVIYTVSDLLDLDAGLKGGLNKPETDFTLLFWQHLELLKNPL